MDTYSITYQYEPDDWHSHYELDYDVADMMLRMLFDLNRNCRVRQNATGYVVEVDNAGKEPLTLLHLFFKRISDRNGIDTEDSAANRLE